jgi:RNA recognition motif-containing protein
MESARPHDQSKKEYEVRRTLFICSLTAQTSRASLRKYFSKYGKVINVKISRKKEEIRKHTALVTFKTPKSVNTVLRDKEKIRHAEGFVVSRYLKGQSLISRNSKLQKYRVYIGFIPLKMTDEDLNTIFSKFGKIKLSYINSSLKGIDNQYSNCNFGFVTFNKQNPVNLLMKKGEVEIPETIKKRVQPQDFRKIKTEEWLKKKESETDFDISLEEYLQDVPPQGFLKIKEFKVRTPQIDNSKATEQKNQKSSHTDQKKNKNPGNKKSKNKTKDTKRIPQHPIMQFYKANFKQANKAQAFQPTYLPIW